MKTAKCRYLMAGAVGLITLVLGGNAQATLTPVGPFTGNLSENWESFDNYVTPFYHHLSPTVTIMGGGATVANPLMAIYQPGVADFSLGYAYAQVSDGFKAMGIDASGGVTISFLNPVSDFGAYWGAANGNGISLTFSDGSLEYLSYTSEFNHGALVWSGWHSSLGITSINYSGAFVVIDGLQANSAVPEPSTYLAGALLVLVCGMQGARTLRNRKQTA